MTPPTLRSIATELGHQSLRMFAKSKKLYESVDEENRQIREKGYPRNMSVTYVFAFAELMTAAKVWQYRKTIHAALQVLRNVEQNERLRCPQCGHRLDCDGHLPECSLAALIR